jgi:hypothetical protein
MNDKYFAVRNEGVAKALTFLTGQKYMVFNDLRNVGQHIFSFENTEKIRLAKLKLNELKEELNK